MNFYHPAPQYPIPFAYAHFPHHAEQALVMQVLLLNNHPDSHLADEELRMVVDGLSSHLPPAHHHHHLLLFFLLRHSLKNYPTYSVKLRGWTQPEKLPNIFCKIMGLTKPEKLPSIFCKITGIENYPAYSVKLQGLTQPEKLPNIFCKITSIDTA